MHCLCAFTLGLTAMEAWRLLGACFALESDFGTGKADTADTVCLSLDTGTGNYCGLLLSVAGGSGSRVLAEVLHALV